MRYSLPVLVAAAIFGLLVQPFPVPAQPLPIIDLHFHPAPGWDLGALVSTFDSVGVARAGNGAVGPDSVALLFGEKYPDRFLPFAGQNLISSFVLREGPRAWKLESEELVGYLNRIEGQLRDGRSKGLGEFYPNNLNSHPDSRQPTRYPADSPLMQRLWLLSATYGVPLSVHMEAEGQSVAEMERLLASDRRGTWVWAHCGNSAQPPLVRRLLQVHPNLHCELSRRLSEQLGPGVQAWAIDDTGRLQPPWRALIEQFPDRFVIGTDCSCTQSSTYVAFVRQWRQILAQLSDQTAAKVAHENAERILRLPPTGR